MDLLEKYLSAIKPLLPRKAQDDILRELSENIRCEMEEKEEAVGRALTTEEQEEIIQRHGHPVTVASRYSRIQYLIGPEVFPFYWLFLRIALVGALVIRLILAFIETLTSPAPEHAAIPALLAVPGVAIPVFFWVTAAFAAFELSAAFFHLSCKKPWNPRSLPTVGPHVEAVSRAESAAQIIFGTLGALWWISLPAVPYLAFGPAAHFVVPGPIWAMLYTPIMLLILVNILMGAVNLVRPQLSTGRQRLRLASEAASLGIACLLLRAGNWVVIAPGADPARYAHAIATVNQILYPCFLAAVIISAAQLAWHCLKQIRYSRPGQPFLNAMHKF